jgi:hypothetical protein
MQEETPEEPLGSEQQRRMIESLIPPGRRMDMKMRAGLKWGLPSLEQYTFSINRPSEYDLQMAA